MLTQSMIDTIREALEHRARNANIYDALRPGGFADTIPAALAELDKLAELQADAGGVAGGLPMPDGTCFVVMEWQDGCTRIPIAVCATRAQAEAMQDAFRDIEEAPWESQAQPAQEGSE